MDKHTARRLEALRARANAWRSAAYRRINASNASRDRAPGCMADILEQEGSDRLVIAARYARLATR